MAGKFYIVGHNPNNVGDAVDYLREGANGIEPDICYVEDSPEKFYVYEKLPLIPEEVQDFIRNITGGDVPSLKNYLLALKQVLLVSPHLKLALIAFDLKPPYSYNINDLYGIIRDNFTRDFPKVSVLTTASLPSAMSFLAKIRGQSEMEAVGIDENTKAKAVKQYFNAKGLRYTYANGTSVPGISSASDTFADQIRIAASMRSASGLDDFKTVHAWTVNSESSMKTYLDIGVDGMITDKPSRLKNLISLPPYNFRYRLATDEDKPFQ